ncbi:IST1-like protein [Tanacetum coccineum]
MFDILKSKFYKKCKSKTKMTRKRIEIIKRKRNAMEKFLRNDVADLLRNNLDSNAYSRVEQLYADRNLSSCYDFVDQSCLLVLTHLSPMSKQRECPDECKEAISTLMFAAARFADLPELRELRTLFVERYGNSIEPYVNPEFVNNLKADPPAKAIKLQMMQEIATQYGITWNSKSLETKLYTPPVVKDWSQYGNGTKNESPKPRHQNVSEAKIQETEKKHYIKQTEVTKKDDTLAKELPYKRRAETEKKEDNQKDLNVGKGLPYKPRAEVETKKDGSRSPYWSSSSSSCDTITSPEYSTGPDDSPSEDIIPKGRNFYAYESTRKSTSSDTTSIDTPKGRNLFAYESTRKSTSLVTASTSGREENASGFGSMPPPPYIKTESTKKSTTSDATSEDLIEERKLYGFRSMAPPYIKTDLTKKVTAWNEKVAAASIPNEREEGFENISKPVPRSMRNRRPFQPVAGSSRANNEIPKPSPKRLHGENLDRGVDEEEMKMDKLLSHYSRKPTHTPSAPTRSGSLPAESVATPTPIDERKGLARAATYQPDSALSPQGHVHPKLPDYDHFVAQLAAFRARS